MPKSKKTKTEETPLESSTPTPKVEPTEQAEAKPKVEPKKKTKKPFSVVIGDKIVAEFDVESDARAFAQTSAGKFQKNI